jgi:hypothetical protein
MLDIHDGIHSNKKKFRLFMEGSTLLVKKDKKKLFQGMKIHTPIESPY